MGEEGREGGRRKKTHQIYLLHFSHGRCLDGSVKKTCGDLPCVKGLVLSLYVCVCMCVTEGESTRERERKLGVRGLCLQSHLVPAEVISPQQVVCHSATVTQCLCYRRTPPPPFTPTPHSPCANVWYFFSSLRLRVKNVPPAVVSC